jgi:hypothetical protein
MSPWTDNPHPATRRLIIWLAVMTFSVALAGLALYVALSRQQTDLSRQIETRHYLVQSTCLIQKAIIDAGTDALTRGVLLPGDRVVHGKFLPGPVSKRLGPAYPSYHERLVRSHLAAEAYENKIATAVEKAAGDKHRAPLTHHKLDCAKLARNVSQ